MQLVGHSDDRTHDGYTHTLPGAEDAISKGLAGLFTRPTDETGE